MANAPFERTTPTAAGGSDAPPPVRPAPAQAAPPPAAHAPAAAPGPPASGPTAPAVVPEAARERVNRRWAEILQETRVAQTGGQILFGLLLSIAFTARFQTLSGFEYGL